MGPVVNNKSSLDKLLHNDKILAGHKRKGSCEFRKRRSKRHASQTKHSFTSQAAVFFESEVHCEVSVEE
jgi:hypothetical protein